MKKISFKAGAIAILFALLVIGVCGCMNKRISDVQSLMDTTKWTLDQVLDALKITEQKERQSIIKAVQGGC